MIGKIIVTVGCAVLVYLYLETSDSYTYDDAEAINADGTENTNVTLLQSPIVPVVVTAGLAFFVSSLFFYTYQLGVDTLLMCFIEEKTLLEDASKHGKEVIFSGPKSLTKYMNATQADVRKQAEAEGEDVKGQLADAKASETAGSAEKADNIQVEDL